MSQFLNLKKNYFYYFLLIYFISGIFLSLDVGITHDEYHSFFVGDTNKKYFLNTLFGLNYDYQPLSNLNLHYGSGFYFISAPIESIISLFFNLDNVSLNSKKILVKHPTIFIFFVISGIYLRKIIYIITEDKNYSSLSTFLYLTYPYLLGHSFFNVKDIPFLSIWLISTFYIIKITKLFYEEKKIRNKDLIILAFLTSFLLSIRISGVLIFFEYLIFLLFVINILDFSYLKFCKLFYKKLILFSLSIIIIFYILSPAYWDNPLEVVNGLKSMSQHIQTVCTVTLGECMKAQNLPSSYLPIWFFFKLPVIIILGIIFLIFKEKIFFHLTHNTLFVAPIIVSTLLIIFLLILLNVNLYDELRQVMFLIPLFFIIALSALFLLTKKVSYFLISIFVIFFVFQNIKMYPYNYIWLNNFTNFIKVSDNFELDYWGVSSKKIALIFNEKKIKSSECIISNRNRGIEDFIVSKDVCFLPFQSLHKKNIRPFYVALMERSTKKGLPNNCDKIHSEEIQMNFSKENLVMAKIFKCN